MRPSSGLAALSFALIVTACSSTEVPAGGASVVLGAASIDSIGDIVRYEAAPDGETVGVTFFAGEPGAKSGRIYLVRQGAAEFLTKGNIVRWIEGTGEIVVARSIEADLGRVLSTRFLVADAEGGDWVLLADIVGEVRAFDVSPDGTQLVAIVSPDADHERTRLLSVSLADGSVAEPTGGNGLFGWGVHFLSVTEVAYQSGVVRRLDLETGESEALPVPLNSPGGLSVSSDGLLFVSSVEDDLVALIDLASGTHVTYVRPRVSKPVLAADGSSIIGIELIDGKPKLIEISLTDLTASADNK